MKKFKIILFILSSILAAFVMYFPPVVLFGYMLSGQLGLILLLIPTAFIYLTSALILGSFLDFFKVPFPTIISLVLILGISYQAAHKLNAPIIQQVENIRALDRAMVDNFSVPNTMAIYSRDYARSGDACNALCQGLLYNHVSEKVLILTDPFFERDNIDKSVTAYEIREGLNCSTEYVHSKYGGKLSGKSVDSRLAAGECLVKESAALGEAAAIFVHNEQRTKHSNSGLVNLNRNAINIDYVEIFKNTGKSFEQTYRYSEISTHIFVAPLLYGPIFGGSGGNMHLEYGFLGKSLRINNPGPSYGNPIKEFKPEMENIFGKALDPIKPANQTPKEILKNALDNEVTENTAALGMLEYHLRDLYMNRKTPTDEDMKLVIEALKDDRTQEWFHLSNFTWLWGEKRGAVPKEYAEELANRILKGKNIQQAGRAIRFLPDGDAAVIYPQLEKITNDKTLRNRAYGAVIRLGDGGAKALPAYVRILEEYKRALNETDYNLRKKQLRELGDAPIASVIGMCRLGTKAKPAKEHLYGLLDGTRYSSTLGGSAIDALIEMGLTEELIEKYKSDKKLMKEIEKAIAKKERSIEKSRRFCGRRIV